MPSSIQINHIRYRIDLFFEFGPGARHPSLPIALYSLMYLSISWPRESLQSSEQAFSVEIADSFIIWSIFTELDFHSVSRGVHAYSCRWFSYRAGVFAASRSTGRCPVSYSIDSVEVLPFVIRAFPEIEGQYADDTTVFVKDERSILGLWGQYLCMNGGQEQD